MDRWQQISRLFHAALAQPVAARDEYLHTECAGDDELKRQVESLLAATDETRTSAGGSLAHRRRDVRQPLAAGQRVSHYRIVGQLGAGGMGEVYRARDEHLERDVALKVLAPFAFQRSGGARGWYAKLAPPRNLEELRIGIDAGHRLDAVSDRLSVSWRYSYAIVEQVDDLPNSRSNMALEAGLLATRRMSARVILAWQRSHGGLRSTEFTDQNFLLFDRVLEDNSFHLGWGGAYTLPRMDVFASYTHYAAGTDTHGGRAFTAGVSVPFER